MVTPWWSTDLAPECPPLGLAPISSQQGLEGRAQGFGCSLGVGSSGVSPAWQGGAAAPLSHGGLTGEKNSNKAQAGETEGVSAVCRSADNTDSILGPPSCPCSLDDLSWSCVLGPWEVNIHTLEMPLQAGIGGGC